MYKKILIILTGFLSLNVWAQGSAIVPDELFFSDSSVPASSAVATVTHNIVSPTPLHIDDTELQHIVINQRLTHFYFINKLSNQNKIVKNHITLEQVKSYMPDLWQEQAHFRVLNYGQARTMDYNAQRINIQLNKKSKIIRLFIG